MKKRDLIRLKDLSKEDILKIFKLSQQLKKNPKLYKDSLKGKSLGLIFQKPSNRTRVSFEVGISQLGGNCIYLGPDEINLGVRETTHDVAKTLSRYLSGIIARTFSHDDIKDLAKYASIPIINGLSDVAHPCQALTDIFSVFEKFKKLQGLTMAYIGDGNNVCQSLMVGCSKVGIHLKVATPVGYGPRKDALETASIFAKQSKAIVEVGHNPKEAVKGADVIYTDTWVSMGQEEETQKRLHDFEGFQVNADLVKGANKDFIFMHCLPAHRGQEVTDAVIDGKHSIIFDQAENRLHVQKAILIFLLAKDKK